MTTMVTPQERIHDRPYTFDDFERVRQLLVDTYPLTPTGFNWEVRRWDGWNLHRSPDELQLEFADWVHLWETDTGTLVGVAHSEDGGDLHIEIHPDYRGLEADMIAWGEAHLAKPEQPSARPQLDIFVFEYDAQRRRLLESRGYEKTQWGGMIRRMRFGNAPLPPVELERGYTLRGTRSTREDYQRVADILNAAFNRTMHNADEFGNFARRARSYIPDLNLVAEAPDGSFGAMVGICWDDENRLGIFEPVCTHPQHRRKGLARALMFEGLHRLKAMHAADVIVGTGDDPAANALYDAVGFTEAYKGYTWRKVL